MCLYIRMISKICELTVVKLIPLSLGNSLNDQTMFAWSLVLPAERWSWLELVAGAGEAGGRVGQGGVFCTAGMGQWQWLPSLYSWECDLWECRERGVLEERETTIPCCSFWHGIFFSYLPKLPEQDFRGSFFPKWKFFTELMQFLYLLKDERDFLLTGQVSNNAGTAQLQWFIFS